MAFVSDQVRIIGLEISTCAIAGWLEQILRGIKLEIALKEKER